MIGLATVSDSLAVIKKIVFEQNLLSLDEMISILKRNFKGIYSGKTGKEWGKKYSLKSSEIW
ncbi:MAG: pyruvate formate lyase family protein [Promethearchaeota archaeon]